MSLIKNNQGGYFSFRPFINEFFNDRISLNKMFDGEDYPAVNIVENEKNYEIEVAAPGMKKEDFKVEIENGVLTISAEKKEEKKESKKNYTRQEYYYNSFTRSFTLPENAKEDDLVARYEDGMLKLAVAKKAITVSKAREIEVA
ncbi:MAG: Hsp20/alpha crystallin family protein [Bacteroidota bacterium]|jgi:HSP20 family protein